MCFRITPFTKRRDRPLVTNDELRAMICAGDMRAKELLDARLARYASAAKINKENMQDKERWR